MGSRARWLPLLVAPNWLLVSPAARAGSPEVLPVAIIGTAPSQRLRALEIGVAEAAAGIKRVQLILPSAVLARLVGDSILEQRRRRAAALLERAVFLAQRVRYDEALRNLESAETAALDGLARFARPRLLADIHYHRGLALLPTDRAAAQRHLVQSLLLWPHRAPSPEEESPKILEAMQAAAAEARAAADPPIDGREAAQLAAIHGARLALALIVRGRAGEEQLNLLLFDGEREALLRSATVRLRRADDPDLLRRALKRALRRLFPQQRQVRPRRSALLGWAPWATAGLGGATLIAGTVLASLVGLREREAEELAGQDPLVAYEPRVEELERSGRRLQTASIVCFCVAGVAAATAVALWLLPRRRPARRADLTLGAGALRMSF